MTVRLGSLNRELGPINTIWYLVAKLVRRLGLGRVYRYSLFAQPVHAHAMTPARKTNIEFRFVEQSEYIYAWFPRPVETIRIRYKRGARCLVAFKGGIAIGCIWMIDGEYIEDELFCRYVLSPKNRTIWDFDVYLLPEYRFGRTFSRLWDTTELLLAEEGRHWCLSRIDVFNTNSIRAHQRRGAVNIGEIACVRTGSIQLFLSTVSPYVHITYRDRSMPRIDVTAPTQELTMDS